MTDTKGARVMRGLVKAVFIGCYAAFMWASIHHVATFFNNFEQDNANTFGSYLLAGAFDITALVSTIGVMFFRKSMPGGVLVVVWAFIIAIAGYSFFINWEYAMHFQGTSLTMQPTGATIPVYDKQGQLHYVPEMTQNTALLVLNPILASGFTIFSLIYSVIAEFFGAKPPTAEELKAKLEYLESIADVQGKITKLEEKDKKPGLIQRGKQAALELKDAVKEVTKKDEKEPEIEASNSTHRERITGPLGGVSGEDDSTETAAIQDANTTVSEMVSHTSNVTYLTAYQQGQSDVIAALDTLSNYYPKIIAWRSIRGKSVPIRQVIDVSGAHHKTVYALVQKGTLTRVNRAPDKVLLTSVIEWLINEVKTTAKEPVKAAL